MSMEIAGRLREAIKQTRIAIEETDRPDVLRILEEGLERLENGPELLETNDEK